MTYLPLYLQDVKGHSPMVSGLLMTPMMAGANQLAGNLATSLPAGVQLPTSSSPTAVSNLPAALHTVYVTAVTDAIHPLFLASAGIMLVGFVLTWFLCEIPLRTAAPAPYRSLPAGTPRSGASVAVSPLIDVANKMKPPATKTSSAATPSA